MKYNGITLGQVEAVWNKLGGVDGVERFLRGEMTVKEQGLLRLVTTVSVNGTEKFVANDQLKAANVGWTGDNFKTLFLNRVEEKVSEVTVVVHRLEKDSLDAPILAEMGSRAEIQLAHFFKLLEKQSKGEKGPLLVNGYANIAYVRDDSGTLWAVHAPWSSGIGCWSVEAFSVGPPRRWYVDCQVLSRDS